MNSPTLLLILLSFISRYDTGTQQEHKYLSFIALK